MHGPEFVRRIGDGELELSPAARDELARILAACDDPRVIGVRLFVAGGGCSGMRYALTFTDRADDHDRVLESGPLRVVIDAIAFCYLEGARIDFRRRAGGDTFVFEGTFRATGGSGLCGGCGAAGS